MSNLERMEMGYKNEGRYINLSDSYGDTSQISANFILSDESDLMAKAYLMNGNSGIVSDSLFNKLM